jgi:hypothetical protein
MPVLHDSYIHIHTHILYRVLKVYINVYMYVCVYVYDYAFPLHWSGPGYWLLSRRVVPPPQSDHCKQQTSGESTHPIRHKKGHHIIHVSNTKKINTLLNFEFIKCRSIYKTTWWVNVFLSIRLGRRLYLYLTYISASIAAPLSRRSCTTGTWSLSAAI